MKYRDLRDFVDQLAQEKDVKEIEIPVSPCLEMTEVSRRVLVQDGPALFSKIRKGVPCRF